MSVRKKRSYTGLQEDLRCANAEVKDTLARSSYLEEKCESLTKERDILKGRFEITHRVMCALLWGIEQFEKAHEEPPK